MGNPLYHNNLEEDGIRDIRTLSTEARNWISHHLSNALMPVLYFIERCMREQPVNKNLTELAWRGLHHALKDIGFIIGREELPAHGQAKKEKTGVSQETR